MTSLHVIYDLGPPIKNPGYAYAPQTLKMKYDKAKPSSFKRIYVITQ